MRNLVLCIGVFTMLLISPVIAAAQELNGSIIYVSDDVRPFVLFMGQVQSADASQPSCYIVQSNGNRLQITPGRGASRCKNCILAVTEGTGSKQRNHTFAIVYNKEAGKNIYDYSSKKLLQEEAAFLLAQNADKTNSQGRTEPAGRTEKPKKGDQKQAGNVVPHDAGTIAGAQQHTRYGPDTEDGDNELPGQKKMGPVDIDSIPTEQINERTRQVIGWFYKCCKQLSERKSPSEIYVARGMRYFRNDTTKRVELTVGRSLRKDTLAIRTYLTRFGSVKYKSVRLTQSDAVLVTNLHKTGEGKYKGSAVVKQIYEGLGGDGQVKYRDITSKVIEVDVDVFHETIDGKRILKFEVYLGDISVTNEKGP